ncbi:HEPN domain-containing protein [Candidatus Woesearchaeota archaeon]|nr:HEPN domain-containing protein [Candidatus Woesearchaeota archaeon]
MRIEIKRWLEQGLEELDTAEKTIETGKWFAVAFWCQQAVEKVLKAYYLFKKKESPGTTHSLTFLGRELLLPKEHWNFLRDLTKEYYLSRYPDATEDVPYKLYHEKEAREYFKKSKDLILWVKSQLKE